MPKLDKILVPVDFSPGAAAAFEGALRLLEGTEAEILVLHIWEAPSYVAPDIMIQVSGAAKTSLLRWAFERLGGEMDTFLANFRVPKGIRVEPRLEAGNPAEKICEIAEQEGFDLIAMGTHGRTGLAHLVAGSVAEKVVRRSKVPVLTTR